MYRTYLARVFFMFFLLYSCISSPNIECGLKMPEYRIESKFCDSKFQIIFDDNFDFGGLPPYQFQWSNGEETLNNTNIDGPGIYQLTLTDSKGCNSITSFNVKNDSRLPLIKDVSISEIFCDKETANIAIKWYCSTNIKGNSSGFEYEYFDPLRKENISRIFHITKTGVDVNRFISVPTTVDKFTVRPFYFTNKRIKCYGKAVHLEIPNVILPVKYFESYIEIKKRNPYDCDANDVLFLEGYCGSPFGCKLNGVLNKEEYSIEEGSFKIELLGVSQGTQFTILPILDNVAKCKELDYFGNNFGAIGVEGFESGFVSMAGHHWTDGDDCNCYNFELDEDSDRSVIISNSQNSTEGSVVTQMGSMKATLCITNDGPHCVTVTDKSGCANDFCFPGSLQVREIEVSNVSIVNETQSPKLGSTFIRVGRETALPVIWNVGALKSNVTTMDESSIVLSGLAQGKYVIEVFDANGCATEFEFKIKDCRSFIFIANIGIYEGYAHLKSADKQSSPRFLTAYPIFVEHDIKELGFTDYDAIQDALPYLAKYNWIGPKGFTSNEQVIFPTKTGRYCVEIDSGCEKIYRACYDFQVQ